VNPADALLQIAEIAIGLAGFGGIFVALSRERGVQRPPADTYRLVVLLCTALSTLVLATLPVALLELGVADATVWSSGSGVMVVGIVVLLVVTGRFRRRHRDEIREGEFSWAANVIWVLAFALAVAQIGNALGAFAPERAFGVFLLGLIFLLAFGSYLFARMLFLWRS
jgi:hypothetical protein